MTKQSKVICAECGIGVSDPEGCSKHPYCKKCFKEVWNNDYDAYAKWLDKTHM